MTHTENKDESRPLTHDEKRKIVRQMVRGYGLDVPKSRKEQNRPLETDPPTTDRMRARAR